MFVDRRGNFKDECCVFRAACRDLCQNFASFAADIQPQLDDLRAGRRATELVLLEKSPAHFNVLLDLCEHPAPPEGEPEVKVEEPTAEEKKLRRDKLWLLARFENAENSGIQLFRLPYGHAGALKTLRYDQSGIRKRYALLLLLLHPDKNPGPIV